MPPAPDAEPRISAEQEQLAGSRDRGFMHPELDPVKSIGNELLGNDFRSRTPRLGSNTEAPVLIDQDQAYLRRMAMFEQRATFSSSIPAAPWSEHYVEPGAQDFERGATHPNAEPDVPEPDRTGLLMILVGGAALIAVGVYSKR